DDVPVAIDDHCRVGLVDGEEALDCLADGRHVALIERALAEYGGETGGQEEAVAVSQRNVQALGEVKDHFAARPGASRPDEAEMPRGARRSQGKFELAEVAPLPPLT